MPESELAARIRSVAFRALSATAFRHVAAGADPRSGLGAKIHGGRWNPPDSWPTIYLGFSEATVRAEWARAASRQGLTLEDFLPRDLYAFDLELAEVLDLRDPAARRSVEPDQALRTTAQAFCRRIGAGPGEGPDSQTEARSALSSQPENCSRCSIAGAGVPLGGIDPSWMR